MRNFIPFQFPFASNEHKSFFEYAMHEIGSTYPNVIAAVYLLSACPETRDNIWEMIDLDGGFKDDFWEFWESDDSRRCVALAVNFLCGGYYPVLSPSYLYDTPLAPILWAAMEFWYHNRDIA